MSGFKAHTARLPRVRCLAEGKCLDAPHGAYSGENHYNRAALPVSKTEKVRNHA